MAVILGSLTTVTINGQTDGIQSANWQIQVSTNRLWELGSWDAYATQVTKTESVSITTYAGVVLDALGAAVTLTPNIDCDDSTAVLPIGISVQDCGGFSGAGLATADRFITSYSYSKGDPNAFGTESWSMQDWIDAGVTLPLINTGAPSAVIQGKSEGNYTGNLTNMPEDVGITMEVEGQVSGSQGSVSAGFPGIGNADTTVYGFVSEIGTGRLEDAGKVGQSSVSIPHQPLYLGT